MKKKLRKFLQRFKSKKAREAMYISQVRASEYFNEAWYLQKYPDVRIAGVDAATHYVKYGWKEGRNPGPDFDTMLYISAHGGDICPLVDFHKKTGNGALLSDISITSLESMSRLQINRIQEDAVGLITGSKYFDAAWYREHYQVTGDAVAHYSEHADSCNPSLLFDSTAYLAEYPDVKKVRMNPLVHYEMYGKHEGRYTFPVISENERVQLREKLQSGNVQGLKVLYISGTARIERPILDASTRYRCFHPAETLQEKGAAVHITSADMLLKRPIPYGYDIYVFHRPSLSLEKIIRSLNSKQKILIAEYDDLIFGGEEEALNSSIYKNKVRPRQYCINLFESNAKALRLFSYVSVSTEDLASHVMKVNSAAKVQVIHNFIPRSILTQTKKLHTEEKDLNQIIYCCGTLSHNEDFKIVSQSLVDCLKKDNKLRLILMGPLSVEGELCTMPNVYFHPHVDYWKLFQLMSNSSLALAPLEMSMFNDCKSNVKFLEACVSGACLLATPIPDMVRVGDADIILCRTAEDFQRSIENRHQLRTEEMAQRNYAYLLNNCSSVTFLKEFSQLLKKIEI
ncbi:MAG: glycosyltransferase [Akkermansia sp.]|nr:glycosyltransferase [Akkermansia sp.]